MLLACVITLVPLPPHPSGSANAAVLLARVVRATATTPPLAYSGTAELTQNRPNDQLVPPKAGSDLGAVHITSIWAIADSTHFRIETKTSSPPLETQTSIYAAAGGTSEIWYRDIDAVALRMPLPKTASSGAGNLLTGGALPLTGGTIEQYVDQYNHLKSGVHARLLAPQAYLGRAADVVEVHPVWNTTSSSCTTDAHGKQQCKDVTRGYGRERIWVDHEHLVILKVQVTGLARQNGGNYTYAVTSITFGQQPTPDQLAFTSPVPITKPTNNSQSNNGSSGSTIGVTTGWQAPAGFISVGAPTGPKGKPYYSTGSGQEGEPGGQGTAGVSVLFGKGRMHTQGTTANFVLVQERRRENGPPALFATGTKGTAGTCQVMTGTFPDGLHWLGFARQDIYVLVSSDSFSEQNLTRYVATAICR